MGGRGTGRPNLAHETKFSTANEYREKKLIFPVHLSDHEQDWQPYYPVDPYSCYKVMAWHTLSCLRDSDDSDARGSNSVPV